MAGLLDLFVLLALWQYSGMGLDVLRDAVRNRPIESHNDYFYDNLLRLLPGINRYVVWRADQVGLLTATKETLLPPTKVFDDLWKDFTEGFERQRTTRSIPVVGQLYYEWFARPAYERDEAQDRTIRNFQQTTNRRTDNGLDIPDLPPLSEIPYSFDF